MKHHGTCVCKPCWAEKMAADVKLVVESASRSLGVPYEASLPPVVALSPASTRAVAEAIKNPPAPTQALRDLMKEEP